MAPAWARERLAAALQATHGAPPPLTQLALAAFIREGHLARHVGRMRRSYAARREILLQMMERHAGGLLRPLTRRIMHPTFEAPGPERWHLASRQPFSSRRASVRIWPAGEPLLAKI